MLTCYVKNWSSYLLFFSLFFFFATIYTFYVFFRIRRLSEVIEEDYSNTSVRGFRGRPWKNTKHFRYSSSRDHRSFDRSFERGNYLFILSVSLTIFCSSSLKNFDRFPQVDGVELNMTAGSKERLVHFVKGLKDELVRKSYDKRIFLVLPTKSEELAKQFDLKELTKWELFYFV